MNLPQLPQDKANHVIYGVAAFAVGHFALNWQLGLIMAVALGAAKEIYDKVSKSGEPSIEDFAATVGGGVLGYLCTLVR